MVLRIIGDYFAWHYGEALVSYIRILKNFWWFIVAYFSLPLLFSTLFLPYRQFSETTTSNISSWLEASVMNTLSRLVGLVVRLFVITIGLVSLALLTLGGIAVYAFWLIAPFLPASLALIGVLLFYV